MHPLESSVGQLYFGDGDGNFIPFVGVQDIQFNTERNTNEVYASMTPLHEFCTELELKLIPKRYYNGMLDVLVGKMWTLRAMRFIRHERRMQEKERRAKLKGD